VVNLGKVNKLKIVKSVDFGIYLDGGDSGEILLPKRYVTPDMVVDQELEVFIYLDGEERIIATTNKPLGQVDQVAYLKVKSVEKIGAFLEWGIMKDILVPFSEQKIKMEVGKSYLVYIYIDKITQRVTATMKLEKFLDKTTSNYHFGSELDGIVWTQTDIAYKVVLNNSHLGLLYKDEVFKRLQSGDKLKVYVKKVRTDNKLDLSLEKPGYKKLDGISTKILDKLKKEGGFMAVHDKTNPEIIYNTFGVSKKAFKAACGNLYKQKLIDITASGIKILNEQ